MRKLAIAAALGLAFAGQAHAQQTIKIGLIMPLTGTQQSV